MVLLPGIPDSVMANVRVLVVAGGGGGGDPTNGGGGGGGGVAKKAAHAVIFGSYAVTVGAGGAVNANGGDSSFDSIIGKGGGAGGNAGGADENGDAGGSGGGGARDTSTGGASNQANPTNGATGFGNAGGNGGSAPFGGAGGGGGAGAAGSNGQSDGTAPGEVGGNGGNGTADDISGSSVTYGGGGGGSCESNENRGMGGTGGGGNGQGSSSASTVGTANLGGGGGGGHTVGRAGGSGVVIIRYATADFPVACTGGSISTDGSDTIHTFTTSGTFSVVAVAPTSPAVTAANASQVLTVTWVDSVTPNVAGYSVERSDDGSTGWAEIATVAPGVQTYADNVAAWSTRKYYRIRAYSSGTPVYSAYTSTVNATTAPQAPSAAAVAPANDSNILTLSWTDNSSDEDTFSIEVSANGVSGWSELTTDTASPYAHDVTTRDTLKYYRVRAKRNADSIYSGYTDVVSATTAPANPTTLAATVAGQDVTVTFVDVSTTNTSTKLERKTDDGSYSEITSLGAAVATYTDEDLTHYQNYTYRARAHRSSDNIYSGYSNTDTIIIPPEPPQNLTAACSVRATAASKVRLAWEIYSEKETGFKIERSLNNVDWSTVTTTAAGVRTYEDTGLALDTTYYYRVSAAGPDGVSTSATATVKTSRGKVADLLLAFDKKTGQFPLS